MSDSPEPWLTVEEAAALLGVNGSRIRQLIGEGRLEARRWNYNWQITRISVENFQRLKRGRPRAEPEQES